jgi:transcriptional regulator with XRE-family HTH domain
MNFSDSLKRLRTAAGLSQRALAKQVNLHYSTIGMYETGKREPDLDTIKKFASYFGVSLDELLAAGDGWQHIPRTTGPFANEMKKMFKEHQPTLGEEVDSLPEDKRLIIKSLLTSWKATEDESSPTDEGKRMKRMEQNA